MKIALNLKISWTDAPEMGLNQRMPDGGWDRWKPEILEALANKLLKAEWATKFRLDEI